MNYIRVLEDILTYRASAVEEWFFHKFSEHSAVLSTSIDMRGSTYKIVPIDVNFFPAGYNNLGDNARKRAIASLKGNLSGYSQGRALIVMEGHTRNKKYVDSVIVLRDMLCSAGFDVEIGACGICDNINIVASDGTVIDVNHLVNQNGTLKTTSGFTPDFIILNNDLTSGIPKVLSIVKQEVIPSIYLGWFNRSKYRYFGTYATVAREFCEEFKVDPWLVSALFSYCKEVNFAEKKGIDSVADAVENLISEIREKLLSYGINETPYVFIKADNGTYGMGIVNVRSGDDVLNMNKKDRNKMRRIKESNPVENVILQEGVPTDETFCGSMAEPLLYYIGKDAAGYLYRYNTGRSKYENLNVPGCGFADIENDISESRKRTWNTVSKLAVLAAAMEAHDIIGITEAK